MQVLGSLAWDAPLFLGRSGPVRALRKKSGTLSLALTALERFCHFGVPGIKPAKSAKSQLGRPFQGTAAKRTGAWDFWAYTVTCAEGRKEASLLP